MNPLAVARDGARPTILVVDDDADVVTLLEAALQRTHAYAVETAGDVRAALDVLASTLVALIVSDVRMPDIDGFEFFRLLRRQRRYRDIPVIFISAENTTELRVDGFRLGVDDFVTKPVQVSEFVARVESVLRRASRARVAAIQRTHNLAGDFSGLEFSDLVGVLQIGHRTGRLWVATALAPAELLFQDGELLYVAYGNLEGDEAFYALMAEREGQFEFTNATFPAGTVTANTSGSATALLMEGARRIDHGETRQASWPAAVSAGSGSDGPLRPARVLGDEARREAEEALADPFCLGELRLLSSEALRQWTAAAGGVERLHCHLVADLAQGMAAFSALASPLVEDQLVAALRQPPVCAVLAFQLRHGALLDVLLLDQTRPGVELSALRRHPNVVVVAPPGGDFLALPVAARHELATLWKHLRPALVMGVGLASLAPHLKQFAQLAGSRACIRNVLGSIGEPSFDLRPFLVAAVRQHHAGFYEPSS